MTNFSYTASEPQFLCDVCSIAITNPICPSCILEELKAWLTLYPALSKEILPRLNTYLRNLEQRHSDATMCIKCKELDASVCPYCFTERALRELKSVEASKIILREFLQFFNFDFEHTGYYKEAEKLGVF